MFLRIRPSSLVKIVVALLISFSSCALAHNLRVSVYVEGDNLEGEAYFVGGGNPMATGATVDLMLDNKVISTSKTDDDGFFTFASQQANDYLVKVNAGQGHVASYQVSRDEFPAQTSKPTNNISQKESPVSDSNIESIRLTEAELQTAIAKAIRPLREQLERYEAKTRLHDILGGIGYVFGLFGLLIMFRQWKR